MIATAAGPTTASTRRQMIAAVMLAPIAASALLVLPIYVGALVEHQGVSLQDALFITAADLWGMAVALAPAWLLLRRCSWTPLAIASLAVMLAACVGAALVSGHDTSAVRIIATVRFGGGVGAGLLMAIVLTALGRLPSADRAFAFWVVAQILFKVIAIYLFAIIVASAGARGLFLALAALCLPGFVLALGLPVGGGQDIARTVARPVWSPQVGRCFAALVLFYTGLSALWANFEAIGHWRGLPGMDVAAALSVTSLAGLAGAVAGSFAAGRVARRHALAAGIGLIAVASLGVTLFHALAGYAAVGMSFAFAWFFNVPLLLAALNSNDRTGGLMVFANAAIACGVAAGPSLARPLIAIGGVRHAGSHLCHRLPGCARARVVRRRHDRETGP